MQTALILIAALGGVSGADTGQEPAPRGGGARVVAQVVVEVLEPVTNVPRATGDVRARQIRRTRDGRWLVEFQ